MKGNWLKLHRELQDHWVNKRPEWFMGWCHILMATDYETGGVNLTEVYRGLKEHFSKAAWRHFVHKLEQDKMIEILSVENLGQDVGFRQTATVLNFFEYQAKPEQENDEKEHAANNTANNTASTQPKPANNGTDEEPARSQQHSQHAANNTVFKDFKDFKDVAVDAVGPEPKKQKRDPHLNPPKLRGNAFYLWNACKDDDAALSAALELIECDKALFSTFADLWRIQGSIHRLTTQRWTAKLANHLTVFGLERVKASLEKTIEKPSATNRFSLFESILQADPNEHRQARQKTKRSAGPPENLKNPETGEWDMAALLEGAPAEGAWGR